MSIYSMQALLSFIGLIAILSFVIGRLWAPVALRRKYSKLEEETVEEGERLAKIFGMKKPKTWQQVVATIDHIEVWAEATPAEFLSLSGALADHWQNVQPNRHGRKNMVVMLPHVRMFFDTDKKRRTDLEDKISILEGRLKHMVAEDLYLRSRDGVIRGDRDRLLAENAAAIMSRVPKSGKAA